VVSKSGQKGKIDYIQKGGKKVRVKSEAGDTKFWNAALVEKAGPEVSFDDSNSKYVIHEDNDGKQYLTSPDGDNIYVGDTVVSSGKTGFEGEVVGFKSGEFVLVKDPSDGKVKPRKIDKIKLVSSANPAAPESKPTPETSEKKAGDSASSEEELDALPVGSIITIPDSITGVGVWKFEKQSDGKWLDVTDPNDKGTFSYPSSGFKQNFDNGSLIVESLPGQSTPDAQPNLAPGQNLSGLTKEEFDALPVGFQAEMIGTGYIFEKDADGKWVIVEGNA